MCIGGGGIYFITNLELLVPPFAQALDSAHILSSPPPVLDQTYLFRVSDQKPQDPSGPRKEILMERIQSIKEEKQVSCTPPHPHLPPPSRRPGGYSRQEQPWNSTAAKLLAGLGGPDACAWCEGGA